MGRLGNRRGGAPSLGSLAKPAARCYKPTHRFGLPFPQQFITIQGPKAPAVGGRLLE
jgi:hypothetical protein